jgi:hypothetical protein
MSKEDYMRLLAEYNPQRVKTVDAILRETFLQLAPSSASDIRTARDSMSDELRSTFNPSVEPDYMEVDGTKVVDVISEKRMQFLRAVVDIVEKLKDFWPLSIRQIHYQLLNDPPLKQNPQPIHIEALAEKNTLLGIMRPDDSGDAPQPGPFSSSRIAAQSIFELPTQLLSSRFWGANPTNQP